MNYWMGLSLEYAAQKSYLDDLFQVYPTIPEGIREINASLWSNIEQAFNGKDNVKLIENLLKLELFPLKDSYIAYLKRDPSAAMRNPATIDRICGRLYEMGLETIYARGSEPKETNRQIGPFFRRWLNKKSLGVQPVPLAEFLATNDNALLDASDAQSKAFAREHFNYRRNKGLDLVARFNGKYVIGEAKFLTDFGGHQNAQFDDCTNTVAMKDVRAEKVIVLDGYLQTTSYKEMYEKVCEKFKNYILMSILVLRNYLYQI
jgi:hypothetical protein